MSKSRKPCTHYAVYRWNFRNGKWEFHRVIDSGQKAHLAPLTTNFRVLKIQYRKMTHNV